jgi:hypothetical protein
MIDGDQVPVIPFGDVFDKIGAADPEQIGAIAAKFGVTFCVTVSDNVVKVAETH